MKGFKKLSSIVLLLLAFTYPPTLAQAKDSSLNNVHSEHHESETNLVEGTTGELLLTQRRTRRHYYRQRNRQHYYGRRRNRRHSYRRSHRSGQYYRHGQWELMRDRHGRLMYEWQRF
ncbi:hypothetical protein [aff. Roholtiella sp. LEGE 12411]|uniref:hypothetical protein n=1 Tax=aff. Roholtiella sp. LEGE 12411 TaxID=1828822 RepID=UPI0018819F4F|nr:hypothetical protein [aff. Roholtiella sp. LEGE 12411]MBE9035264.1 hypothetical protein [aff. Roholtiella sp. LEGE 12411]